LHRVVTFLTATVLVLGSLGVGIFTADLPFWQRAFQLPLPPDGAYLPTAVIGAAGPGPLATVSAADATLDAAAVEAVAAHAREAGTRALLVMRRGRLEVERYFGADDAGSLLPAGLIARPLAAMAVGRALADGRLPALDEPVAPILREWDGDPRGEISLRQLLEETSGLESGGDIAGLLHRSPWAEPARLPRFATSKGVRLLLGNDFESTALGFSARHEPRAFHVVSPANTQLLAVILERATREPYERYIDEKIWRPLGAGRAELPLDRRAGMPAAHCCWRASARDVLRVANLLATDGVAAGRQVLPPGWTRQMAQASSKNPATGMQLTRTLTAGLETLGATDDDGSAFWVIPERELAIVSIAGPGGGPVGDLPALVLAALRPD
jgi:CubicO group peptidase (beta-lactamase class C family)